MWEAALEQLGNNPAHGWIRALALLRIDGSAAVFAPRRGQEAAAKIASGPPQQKKLSGMLEPLVGRHLSIVIETEPAPARGKPQDPGGRRDAGPAVSNDELEAAPWRDDPQGPASPSPTPPKRDRRSDMDKAHKLPLVRQLMEMFNADVMDAHPDVSAPAPSDPEGAEGGSGGADADVDPEADGDEESRPD